MHPAYIYVETQGGYHMQINCDKKVNFTPIQFYENKELFLEGAEQVLSVQAFARTISVESLSGEVKVGYNLTIRTLYLNQDEMIEKKEETYDLSSIVRGNVSPNAYALINTNVIGVEYHGTENLRVRVMLEQKGFYVHTLPFEPCCKEGLCYKKKELSLISIMPITKTEFVIEGTENLKENIGELLSVDAIITSKRVSCATDLCEIEGSAIVYYTSLVAGEIRCGTLALPFTYDLLLEGVKGGDEAHLFFTPINTTLTSAENENGVELDIQILAEVKGFLESRLEIECPIDAYSKEHELNLNFGELVVMEKNCAFNSTERLYSSIALENVVDAVDIVGVGMPWVGATSVSANPTLAVEGVICSEIIVKREGGEYVRVFVEIPYSFDLKEEDKCASEMEVKLDILSFNARIRFGTSLEISGEIGIEVTGNDERVISFLEKAEEIGERIKNDAVISVYLVGEGETLFDCAKALQSDEEELLALNPELDLPLKVGDKVLLYRNL